MTNKTDTSGGAAIGNDVKIEGGDFVGRDKTIITKSDGLYIVAILALVVIAAIYFSPRGPSTATVAETLKENLDPTFTSQPTNTPAISTKTPNDTAEPTAKMTATPEPESTTVTQAVVTPTTTRELEASDLDIPGAVDQTEIDFCVKDLAYDSLPALDSTLLILAKREAVEELLGGQTISVTKKLDGSVRIFDAPRYYDGKRDDEYCVSFVAYITAADRAR